MNVKNPNGSARASGDGAGGFARYGDELLSCYMRADEPSRRYKGYAWATAIGLQDVDGLRPSTYLVDAARKNIEGELDFNEVHDRLDAYYRAKPSSEQGNRIEEADKVSARIAQLLSVDAFTFSPNAYLAVHGKLFEGIYSHAGMIRDYDITKSEWVLDGASVYYGLASELGDTLTYDLNEERSFTYKGLTIDQTIEHLARFVSRLWQIHVFEEGNTRTTAVFFIQYLRSLGFDATNDIFAENAWYFRNALVRANYNDLSRGIYETTEYLELFLRNLLLNENNILRNRDLHIGAASGSSDALSGRGLSAEPDDSWQNLTIEGEKPDDSRQNLTIEFIIGQAPFSRSTKEKICKLFDECGSSDFFGRSEVVAVVGGSDSAAGDLLKKMFDAGLIEKVAGHGKGKYRFAGH